MSLFSIDFSDFNNVHNEKCAERKISIPLCCVLCVCPVLTDHSWPTYILPRWSQLQALHEGWGIPGTEGGARGQQGHSAESQTGCWARQRGNHSGLQDPGQTVPPDGNPRPCEAPLQELLVLLPHHEVQIWVPLPGPCGILVESGSGRGCWKVRSQKVSPRRRWLLGESVLRTRPNCGQRPHRVTCAEWSACEKRVLAYYKGCYCCCFDVAFTSSSVKVIF